MERTQKKLATGLVAQSAVLGWRDEICARLERGFGLTKAECDRLLALMLEPGGLHVACEKLGVSLAAVMNERRRNAKFRRALEEVETQRRALIDMLLMDMVVRGLCPDTEAGLSAAREKFLAGLAQTLLERKEKGGRAFEGGKRPQDLGTKRGKTLSVSVNKISPPIDEMEQLIAAAERNLQSF